MAMVRVVRWSLRLLCRVCATRTQTAMMRLSAVVAMVGEAAAHGMMSFPPPRNALDRV